MSNEKMTTKEYQIMTRLKDSLDHYSTFFRESMHEASTLEESNAMFNLASNVASDRIDIDTLFKNIVLYHTKIKAQEEEINNLKAGDFRKQCEELFEILLRYSDRIKICDRSYVVMPSDQFTYWMNKYTESKDQNND